MISARTIASRRLTEHVYADTRERVLGMKASMLTLLLMFLAFTTAAAQAQTDTTATAPITASTITGIEGAVLAGSARASKIIGSKVYKGDTAVGQIEDVLISLDHASVTAVVLSVGGFLGLGEKLIAVPVSQIKVSSEAKFTTELTKEQLAAAPAFDFGKLK
jgi:sporulation protein YlmC with PRC-barrel domain